MKHRMFCEDCRYLPYTVCTNYRARIKYINKDSYCTGFRFSFKKVIKYELSKLIMNNRMIKWFKEINRIISELIREAIRYYINYKGLK